MVEESKGGLKGFLQGLANAVFKPVAAETGPVQSSPHHNILMQRADKNPVPPGCTAFVCHPIFGIYKEFSKIKVVVRHEKSSRARDTPPV
ncbi:hypothetical protein PG989_015524 [Apiospora arundinis]